MPLFSETSPSLKNSWLRACKFIWKQNSTYVEKNKIETLNRGMQKALSNWLQCWSYGIAKVHKIDRNDKVDKLPLRPIVSNISTALYQLAKYLAKLPSLLSKNECTVQSSTEFMEHIKIKTVPHGYHLISFDVIFLFTNVLLDDTVDIVFKRIYDNREIKTAINKREMKELIKLCTKDVQFNFSGTTYVQKDAVAMGSKLTPVLAGIFMVELERAVIPKLSQHLQYWKRYVDDTIVLLVMDTKNLCCHVLIVFIIPSSLLIKLKKKMKYPFLTFWSYVVDRRLRHLFIENLPIQTYTFTGIHMHHLHGNVAHWRRWSWEHTRSVLMTAISS